MLFDLSHFTPCGFRLILGPRQLAFSSRELLANTFMLGLQRTEPFSSPLLPSPIRLVPLDLSRELFDLRFQVPRSFTIGQCRCLVLLERRFEFSSPAFRGLSRLDRLRLFLIRLFNLRKALTIGFCR